MTRRERDRRPELLNARWHGLRPVAPARCCAACLEPIRDDEHVVRRLGDVFHPLCAARAPVGRCLHGP